MNPPPPNRHYRSFVRDHAVVIGGHVLVYLKGIIIMPIIIKSVGVTTYGGFILLTSVLSMSFSLSSLGAGVTSKRYLPAASGAAARRALFYPQLSFNAFTIASLSLLAVLIHANTLARQIVFAVWVPPLYLFSYFMYSQGTDYLRYTARVHYMTVANLCFPYIDIAITLICLAIFGTVSINILVVSMSASALLVATPIVVVVVRDLGVKITQYTWAGFVADVRLGFPLLLNNIVDFILSSSDRYLIAFYLSVTDVGYYVPGYVLGSIVIFVPKAIGTAFPQLLSRAVDEGMESEARTMLDYTIRIFLLLAIPFVFGTLALARPMLALLANEQVAERSRFVAPLVALGTLFYGLTLLLSNALFVRLRTNAMFRVNLVAGLSNLAANVVLFHFFRSILVAAVTTLLGYLGAFVYGYVLVGREWPVNYSARSIVKSIAASAVMFAVLAAAMTRVTDYRVSSVAGLCMLGVTVYVGGLLGLRIFSAKELMFLRRLAA